MKEITDEQFWEQNEDRILDELRNYAERAENGSVVRRRLFAEDAARGFALIDLSRKRYDVVLMNPPFGESGKNTTQDIAAKYPTWTRNILCAFLERAMDLASPSGKVGAIYDRTANIKSTYEDFRRAWLLNTSSAVEAGLDLDGACWTRQMWKPRARC